MDVELLGAGGLHGGQHHRQVLRFAAGHHRVDGHLLDGDGDQLRRHHRHHVLRLAGGALEHAQHACLGGRDHREPVGPAPLEQRLHLVFERGELEAAGAQHPALEADPQLVHQVGVDRQRAAARSVLRQLGPEAPDAGERLPLGSRPAFATVGLAAVLHPEQGGYRLDAVEVRHREVAVVAAAVDLGGEVGVVLGVHGEGHARPLQLPEDRCHQHAGGAVALDDGDEAVRKGRCLGHGRSLRRDRRLRSPLGCVTVPATHHHGPSATVRDSSYLQR
ncbi:MAG: hypothetical protein R2755_31040 [Acidimicrobiales bacterium]